MANDHNNYCHGNNSEIMASQSDENLDPAVDLEDIEKGNFDEVLINLVKQYPHLYDTSLKDYRDSIKKEKSWKEIAKILNKPVDGCVNRWTRLRESFSKEKKKRQIESRSGNGAGKRRGFLHFENMKFLDQFVKSRSSIINFSRKRKAIGDSDLVDDNQTKIRTKQPAQSTSSATTESPPPSTSPGTSNWDDISVAFYRLTSELSSQNDCEESLQLTPSTQHSSEPDDLIRQFILKPCLTKEKINVDRSTEIEVNEKEIENDEFDESFVRLNKAVGVHLKSKRDDPQYNDTDVSFCNLIIAELKQLNEAEKRVKKQEILKILWRTDNT